MVTLIPMAFEVDCCSLTNRVSSDELCIVGVLEKHIVRRTRRLIRVRHLMCWRSMVCVCCVPTVCGSGSMCRSYAPHPSVSNRVIPYGSSSACHGRTTVSCQRPTT
jgi:hypothetical protein